MQVRARKLTAIFVMAIVAIMILPLAGCGGEDAKRKKKKPSHTSNYKANKGGPGAGTASAKVDTSQYGPAGGKVDLSNPATITGFARFEGTPKAQKVLDLSKDKWCDSNHKGTVKSEDLLVDSSAGLQNVLVHLVGLDKHGSAFPAPTGEPQLLQEGCRYTPHILTAMVDQDVKVINADATTHNYHFVGRKNDEINKTQNGKGTDLVSFNKAEVGARFKCDVHPWMIARAHIFNHPCFTVSAADGSYKITGVPPGKYLLSFWHERCGKSSQEITVSAGETKAIGDVKFADN